MLISPDTRGPSSHPPSSVATAVDWRGLGSALPHQRPEPALVEQRDAVALLGEALDLHELEPGVAAGGLERVRPSAHEHGRLERRPAVDRGAGAARGARGDRAGPAQDA